MRRVRREPEGSQSICSPTRPQRRQSTRRTGSCNQTCRSTGLAHAPGGYVGRGSPAWVAGIGDNGQQVGARLKGKQGVMVGRKRLGDDGITWPEGGNINMMHGDSRGDGGGVFGDSQFTSTLSVNFHFPKIPRRIKNRPSQMGCCLSDPWQGKIRNGGPGGGLAPVCCADGGGQATRPG